MYYINILYFEIKVDIVKVFFFEKCSIIEYCLINVMNLSIDLIF